MKEIERLIQAFQTLEVPGDIPWDPYFDNVPDEGQTPEFIEWLKIKPERLQAFFLSCLALYRNDCIPRLLEFSTSTDEEVSLLAWYTLIKFADHYDLAKEKIIAACLNEIKNHANDERGEILGCIREGLEQIVEKEGIKVLKHYRDLALENNAAAIVKWLNTSISGYEREPGEFDLLTEKLKSE